MAGVADKISSRNRQGLVADLYRDMTEAAEDGTPTEDAAGLLREMNKFASREKASTTDHNDKTWARVIAAMVLRGWDKRPWYDLEDAWGHVQ